MAAYKDFAAEVNGTAESPFDKIDDGNELNKIAHALRKIEIKLNALLKSIGKKPGDYAALEGISNSKKLKYFFKLFLSSVGRKANGKNPDLFVDSDKMGNLVICKPVVLENSRLAQMITDFYVKKDKCAYIQIADRIY